MNKKINLTWTGSFADDDCYYDNYEDEKGNIYYCKYELVGWFTDDGKPLGEDVEVEIM